MSFQDFKFGQSQALASSGVVEVGIGGFTAFARVSDSTAYETASPTATVEDGSYIGDHLINAPIKITISGDVADIFIPKAPVSASQARLPTVGVITSFIPGRTTSQAQRVARIINSAADRFKSINSLLGLGKASLSDVGGAVSGKPIREQFIDFIESVHYGKQLVSISMPYRTHDSMVINSVTITRDNQRNALTFTLTAQKFRVAKTLYSNASQFYKKPAPAVKSQVGGVANKGVQSPTSGDKSGAGEKKQKSLAVAIKGALGFGGEK